LGSSGLVDRELRVKILGKLRPRGSSPIALELRVKILGRLRPRGSKFSGSSGLVERELRVWQAPWVVSYKSKFSGNSGPVGRELRVKILGKLGSRASSPTGLELRPKFSGSTGPVRQVTSLNSRMCQAHRPRVTCLNSREAHAPWA